MSDCVEATCTACDGRNQLAADQMEMLGKSESVECSQCGVLVKIKVDAEFPTYFVAIPFILISAIMSSALSGGAVQLQSVDASG